MKIIKIGKEVVAYFWVSGLKVEKFQLQRVIMEMGG